MNFSQIMNNLLQNASVDDEAADRWESEQRQRAFGEWQKNSGMETSYFGAMLERVNPAAAGKVDAFIQNVQNGSCLVLLGGVGTGKTYTACAVMNRLERGVYIDMPELRLKLSTADRYGSHESRESLLHRLAETNLLVLDEVGRFGNAQEQEVLFYLIDKRYANGRATVIISNLSKKEFADYAGQAVIDRIRSQCTFIEFAGQSLR